MVDGFEKRICVDFKGPQKLKARNFPEDIYDVFKEAMAP
jgi:hypothetical protein